MSVVVVNPTSQPVPVTLVGSSSGTTVDVNTTDTQQNPVEVSFGPDMSLVGVSSSYSFSSTITTVGTGAYAGPFLINSLMVPPVGRYLITGTVTTQDTATYYGAFVFTYRMSTGSGALALTNPTPGTYASSLGSQADNGPVTTFPVTPLVITYALPHIVILNSSGTATFEVVYAVVIPTGSTGVISFQLSATPL
jgi:hypothetical protein